MNFSKKAGTKIENKIFRGTKNRRNFLGGLIKQKFGILRVTKNIFNLPNNDYCQTNWSDFEYSK